MPFTRSILKIRRKMNQQLHEQLNSDKESLQRLLQQPQGLQEYQKKIKDYSPKQLFDEAFRARNTIAFESVQVAYRTNFSEKEVHFDLNSNQRLITEHPDHISVLSLPISKLYLRAFNESISKILIMYDDAMNMDLLLDMIESNQSLSELSVPSSVLTNVVKEPVTQEQINRLERYSRLEKLDLSSFRMVNKYANYLNRKLKHLRKFLTRIVNDVNDISKDGMVTFGR